MEIEIVPIAAEHIGGFHGVLDVVARERNSRPAPAPPLDQVGAFVMNNIEMNYVQFVALADSELVG